MVICFYLVESDPDFSTEQRTGLSCSALTDV